MNERYIAVEGSGHQCCLNAHVEDTTKPTFIDKEHWRDKDRLVFDTVCECYDMEQAEAIASALNRVSANL